MDILHILSLITVEPILFLFMMGSFSQVVLMQDLIKTKVCLHSIYSNSCSDLQNASQATQDYVQTEASHWILYTNVALTLPAIFSSLYLGSWCCHYGIKLPLLFPLVGAVIGNFINIFLSLYVDSHVGFLILSQMLSGIFGASICVIMASTSYLSITSTVENRTSRFAVLESMIFLGGTVGPFLGGFLLDLTSHQTVFALLFALNAINMLYVVCRIVDVAPQGVIRDETRKLSVRDYLEVKHCWDSVRVCFKKRSNRYLILLLVLAAVTVLVCTAGEMDTAYLFTEDQPLNWNFTLYSYYFGFKHGMAGLLLLFGLPILRYILKLKDTTSVLLGVASKIAGLVLLAFSATKAMMFTVPVVAMLSAFPVPVIRSILSKLTEPNEHGKLFAFVASAEQLCFLLGTVIFNGFYPLTRNFMHGFVFLFCSALLLIPIVIITVFRKTINRVISLTSENNNYDTLEENA